MSDELKYEDRYNLIWRKKSLGKVVGEIRNYTIDRKGYRRILIIHDDQELKENNFRLLACQYSEQPKIIVSSNFLELPIDLREAGIWHEVGHIHLEHYLDYPGTEARVAAIKEGKIISQELEADVFALSYVSKESIVGFLELTLETRQSGEANGKNELGKKELKLRIEQIRSHKTLNCIYDKIVKYTG